MKRIETPPTPCSHCGSIVQQRPGNIRRTLLRGGKVYCDRICMGLANRKSAEEKRPAKAEFADYMTNYDQLMKRPWSITWNGYLTTRARIDGKAYRIYQHRLVMQRALNREISVNEIIHHIDGCKTNNALSNLAITTMSDHTREHTRERHAETGRWLSQGEARCTA